MRCAIFLTLFLLIPAVYAGDPERGRQLAVTCGGCHGADGISPNDLWPNLAGQQRRYLVKQMKAFRDGSRVDPVMQTFARGLSDEDIDHIAAWYASLPANRECDEKE